MGSLANFYDGRGRFPLPGRLQGSGKYISLPLTTDAHTSLGL